MSHRASFAVAAIASPLLAAFLLLVVSRPFLILPPVLGDDWGWYADGAARLLGGDSLFAPALLAGPYDQLRPELQYSWNHSPALLPLVAPFFLLGETLARLAWLLVMDIALLAALLAARPRGVGIVAGSLTIAALAVSAPIVEGFVWGNVNALLSLAVLLLLVAERRDRRWLAALALTILGWKVLPAVAGAAWLVLRWRRRALAPIVAAGALTLFLSLPAVITEGPRVWLDFVAVAANATIGDARSNLGIVYRLSPLVGPSLASLVSGVVAAAFGVGALLARRHGARALALALASALALVPNLWNHWLLLPIVALLCAADEERWLTSAERRLATWRERVIRQ